MIHNSIFGKAKTYIMGSGRIYETKERPMDEHKEEPNKTGRHLMPHHSFFEGCPPVEELSMDAIGCH